MSETKTQAPSKASPQAGPIVLFDGVCGLCNATVDFLLGRKGADSFRFAALQSEAGQALLKQHDLPSDYLDSVVFVDEDGAWLRTDGVLRIARRMGFPYALLYGLIAVPAFLRDALYQVICNYRYRMFGKRETCRLPSPAERARFLE